MAKNAQAKDEPEMAISIRAELSESERLEREPEPANAELEKQCAEGCREDKPPTLTFNHVEITRFYQTRVIGNTFFTGDALDLIVALLELMDLHDGDESVECKNGTKNAKVPMFLHSMNIANEIMVRAPLVALCIETGKTPFFETPCSETDSHQFSQLLVDKALESMRNLDRFEKLAKTIPARHIRGDGYLRSMVLEADHAARRFETVPYAVSPVKPERRERQRVSPQLKDISGWFDADRFVEDLAEIINKVTPVDRFWSALAIGGYVYVKPSGFYKLIIRHSKCDPAVMAAETSQQGKDDYSYSVVMALKNKKNLVATEFLPADKFGAVFYHNPGPDGTGPKQFLIPFRADYFGEAIGRPEGRRTVLMKKTKELKVAFKTGEN